MQTLSAWKSLKFVVWERVKYWYIGDELSFYKDQHVAVPY